MTRADLVKQVFAKGSYLCVGLDTDEKKLPEHLAGRKDGMLEFNRQIIEATKDHCVSYKVNTAFYEALGARGWEILAETVSLVPATHLSIADAKRGDIGNTSEQYAKAFFDTLGFDAVTVAPYMGADSVQPFLEHTGKWTILLGLTSNAGANDFEKQKLLPGGTHLYEQVLQTASGWGNPGNLMFVIGATQADAFTSIRAITPDHFYLVPGVGAQGGSLEAISAKALNKDCGLLVNASRAIIYASAGEDFADAAGVAAAGYASEMSGYLGRLPNV